VKKYPAHRPLTGLYLLLMLLLSPLVLAGDPPVRQLHVTGEGEAFLAPDMAVMQLTVTREAETAREALDANSGAMQQVLDAMREAGVESRDLRTRQFSIQPRYRHPPRQKDGTQEPPSIVGYQVSNSLEVRVREIDAVGAILDRAVSLGVNQDGQIEWTNADPREAVEAARRAAVKDALARAHTLADAAGVGLGDILEISEQRGSPAPAQAMFRREAMMASADAVPVATGENAYRVTVSLRIALAGG
tara:strand:+ start:1903 stop:2643 length:741 start_codon:yes stop_codon:yes gene_type:complete